MKAIKYIYNFLKVNILIGSIIFSSFGVADSQTSAQKDEKGKLYTEKTYDFKNSVQDADAMSIITSYAIGALGTKLLLYKNWTADMYVAAGGSAVFFACAVMNVIKSKEAVGSISVKIKQYYDGTAIDSKNVEYIRALRESYDEQRKSGERLKSCMKIAQYAFYGAGAIALGLKLRKESQKFNCYGATEHALESMSGVCTSESSTGNVGNCNACLVRMRNFQREIGVRDGQMEEAVGMVDSTAEEGFVRKPTLRATAEMQTPCIGTGGEIFRANISTACSSYIAEGELDRAWGKTVAISKNDLINKFPYQLFASNNNEIPKLKLLLRNMIDKFIPSARANYTEMLGLVGGAATSFITSYYTTGLYIDRYIWSSTGRVIAWGALGVFVGMAISTLDKRIADIEKSIEKIDAILAEMDMLSKGIKASNAKISTVQLNNMLMNDLGSVSLPSGNKFSCLTSNSNSNCIDVASINNANKLSISNLPEAVTSYGSSLGSAISTLGGSDKLSGTKLTSLSDQANNSKAIQKYLKDQQKTLNDLLKSQGKGVIDFDKNEEKFANGLIKTLNNSLEKTPDKGKSLAMSLLGGDVPKVSDKESLTKIGGELSKAIKSNSPVKTNTISNEKKNDDFKLLAEEKDSSTVLANGMREGTANDKYEIKENDINKEKGESIFNIISKRYINSGYPKLLEEIK